MTPFLLILGIINFCGSLYLIFLFYKKYHNPPPNQTDSSVTPAHHYPKIHLVRFNPFNDLGGDQSFILCLLDNQNSGVIITSLHSRHHTRIYAKPILAGKAVGVTLSSEENQALSQTIKNYESKNH